MRAFQRRGRKAVARLDADERAAIATLIAEVRALVGAAPLAIGEAGPQEAAVLRLFPDAVPTDPGISEEFRRLTESDLRSLKSGRLDAMLEDLGREEAEWVISLDDALSVAAALTDVRLVVATRLGLKTDEDADLLRGELDMAQGLLEEGLPEGLGVDQERLWFATVYQALTWLQD
ncbi:MAG: DUF2017 domain-containing protein [Demequinaceae bacterium]|nr:DUF2017 domain-containing protein [Demequinaceae bacterium]